MMRNRIGAVAAVVAVAGAGAGCTGSDPGHPRYVGPSVRSTTSAPADKLSDGSPEDAIRSVAGYVDDHESVHVSIADEKGVFTTADTSPDAVQGVTDIDGIRWHVLTHDGQTFIRSDQAHDKSWQRLRPNTPGGKTMSHHVGFDSVTSFFHVRSGDVEDVTPVSASGDVDAARITIKGRAHIRIVVADDPQNPAPISVTSGERGTMVTLTYSRWGRPVTTRIPPH